MAEPEVQDHNSPAAVTVMTTEHFVWQTARSAGIAEVNGRAGFYLAAVSSGLIALAFIGHLSRLGTAFYVFGVAVLPTLAFVGVTTFERALRNGVEDFPGWPAGSTGSASSIRCGPQVARYLPPPSPDLPAPSYRPSWYQFLTIAGALAVVNSVPVGGVLGLAVQARTGTLAASAAVGVIIAAGALAAHLIRQREIWLTERNKLEEERKRRSETQLPAGTD